MDSFTKSILVAVFLCFLLLLPLEVRAKSSKTKPVGAQNGKDSLGQDPTSGDDSPPTFISLGGFLLFESNNIDIPDYLNSASDPRSEQATPGKGSTSLTIRILLWTAIGLVILLLVLLILKYLLFKKGNQSKRRGSKQADDGSSKSAMDISQTQTFSGSKNSNSSWNLAPTTEDTLLK